MFSSIKENTLHVFGAINFLSIPMVWAFYPETANRTLEEMDHLFMSKSPFVWDEEARFKQWKEESDRATLHGAVSDSLTTDVKVDEKDMKGDKGASS